jgi:hypothetical protein
MEIPDDPGQVVGRSSGGERACCETTMCTRSGGTPSPMSAASAASIIGSGPQMKN